MRRRAPAAGINTAENRQMLEHNSARIITYGIDKARAFLPQTIFARARRLLPLFSAPLPPGPDTKVPRVRVFDLEQRVLQSNATQYFGVSKTRLHGTGAAAHARAKAEAMRDIALFYRVPPKCALLFDDLESNIDAVRAAGSPALLVGQDPCAPVPNPPPPPAAPNSVLRDCTSPPPPNGTEASMLEPEPRAPPPHSPETLSPPPRAKCGIKESELDEALALLTESCGRISFVPQDGCARLARPRAHAPSPPRRLGCVWSDPPEAERTAI